MSVQVQHLGQSTRPMSFRAAWHSRCKDAFAWSRPSRFPRDSAKLGKTHEQPFFLRIFEKQEMQSWSHVGNHWAQVGMN
jgi:hypothetical protein